MYIIYLHILSWLQKESDIFWYDPIVTVLQSWWLEAMEDFAQFDKVGCGWDKGAIKRSKLINGTLSES